MTHKSDFDTAWRGYCPDVACNGAGIPAHSPAIVMRAIYEFRTRNSLTWMPTRQGIRGSNDAVQKLSEWFIGNAEAIQRKVREQRLSPMSNDWVEFQDDRGIFRGTPNGSDGYMYCAVWLKETT
jgi:hypothetical protein